MSLFPLQPELTTVGLTTLWRNGPYRKLTKLPFAGYNEANKYI